MKSSSSYAELRGLGLQCDPMERIKFRWENSRGIALPFGAGTPSGVRRVPD